MSFCADIKNELTELRTPKALWRPLTYGFLLFGRAFSFKRISMQTGNETVAKYYVNLLKITYNAEAQLESGGGKRPTFRASVPNETDRLRILAGYDFGMGDEPFPEEILQDEKAMAVFVRGAFLGCGNISDPETEYRVDFSVREQSRAAALRELLIEHDIPASLSKRGTGFVVYLRKSEAIINLLTWIGLSDRSLELIETTILKSVKNNMNRARNCDNANISKTVEASIRQRTAIAFLEESGRLETLPQSLYSAAVLRRDHPEATLHELCRLSPEPITDSGLNHRLRRLVELYEEYKK